MARTLTPIVDAAMLSESRMPGYTVEIYDIRSTSQEVSPTTIGQVVVANTAASPPVLPAIVGPRDFSADVDLIDITETAGDYASNGIAATTAMIQIQDPTGEFDPLLSPAPGEGRWVRQGNVVVIREGDLSEPDTTQWPITFTGTLVGQAGRTEDRATAVSALTVKANSREVDFLRRINTSDNFVAGSVYKTIAESIAEVDMGLAPEEINFGLFGQRTTAFLSTQFVEESPLVSLAKLMFPDGFMPKFQGDGRLGLTTGNITKGAARSYVSGEQQIRVTRPITMEDGVNQVRIVGIDKDMSEVIQERQKLADASATSGFFTNAITIPVFWSEDKTQQARDVRMEVIQSVSDAIFSFGDEDFTDLPQSDGGSVEGKIKIDGNLEVAIVIAVVVFGAWIGTSFIPDSWAGQFAGSTIPIGRPINAAVGQILFSILGAVGRGQYELTGRPYENVFKEITCTARIANIETLKELEIENHLINTQADCDAVARRVLLRERAKQNARTIEMIHDLRVEPDDIIEIGSGATARKYLVQSIRRRLFRGPGAGFATLSAFETTEGVRP